MELTDEQALSMEPDAFLTHHGLSRDDPFGDTGLSVGDFLEHYGVMGMHWGIRKDANGVRPLAKSLDESKFGQHVKNRQAKQAKKQRANRSSVTRTGVNKKGQAPLTRGQVHRRVAAGVIIAPVAVGMALPLGLVTGTATAVAGGAIVYNMLQTRGLTPVKHTRR